MLPLPESGKEEQVKAKDERSLKIIDQSVDNHMKTAESMKPKYNYLNTGQ